MHCSLALATRRRHWLVADDVMRNMAITSGGTAAPVYLVSRGPSALGLRNTEQASLFFYLGNGRRETKKQKNLLRLLL